jgi:hypothetical protein
MKIIVEVSRFQVPTVHSRIRGKRRVNFRAIQLFIAWHDCAGMIGLSKAIANATRSRTVILRIFAPTSNYYKFLTSISKNLLTDGLLRPESACPLYDACCPDFLLFPLLPPLFGQPD